MEKTQQRQKQSYDVTAVNRSFKPGDKMLVLVPTTESKMYAQWRGPYEVIDAVGPVNYKVRQVGRRKEVQIYHVNLLKPWTESGSQSSLVAKKVPECQVPIEVSLSPGQKQEAVNMVAQFQDVFSDIPGKTQIIQHDIVTPPGVVIKQRPYRIPEAKRALVKQSVEEMPHLGVIEESNSEWNNPIVLVPKPSGAIRFCNDFRKLNQVSRFDTYPMPWIDELVEKLASSQYLTTVD